MVVKNAV